MPHRARRTPPPSGETFTEAIARHGAAQFVKDMAAEKGLNLTAQELHHAMQAIEMTVKLAGAGSKDPEGRFGLKQALADFRAMADEARDHPQARRGTRSYLTNLGRVADLVEEMTLPERDLLLRQTYDAYGWRGVLDFVARWMSQIERSPAIDNAGRDLTGTIDIGSLIKFDADEAEALEHAIDLASRSTDLPFHEVLAQEMERFRFTREVLNDWKPALRAALAQAHRDPDDYDAIWVALFKSPRRADEASLLCIAPLVANMARQLRSLIPPQDALFEAAMKKAAPRLSR